MFCSSSSHVGSPQSSDYQQLEFGEKINHLKTFAESLIENSAKDPSNSTIQSQFLWLKKSLDDLQKRYGRIKKIAIIQDKIFIINNNLNACRDDSTSSTIDAKTKQIPPSPSKSSSQNRRRILPSSSSSSYIIPPPSFSFDPHLKITEVLESLSCDPYLICLKANTYIKHDLASEAKAPVLKFIREALAQPIRAWLESNAKDEEVARRTRSSSALTIANAYIAGEISEKTSKETGRQIRHYFQIAKECYGPQEDDYSGLSCYNYGCWLEEQIVKALDQGSKPENLKSEYRQCLLMYINSLVSNQPVDKTPEVLYKIGRMYYQVISLKKVFKISDKIAAAFVKKAFDLFLEALSIPKEATQPTVIEKLKGIGKHIEEDSKIQSLILLGHLLTQDYFIPGGAHGNGRFETLDQQRLCGYYAYKAALESSIKGSRDYIDALSWAIETCTLISDTKQGQSLARVLLPRIRDVTEYLTEEDVVGLRQDLAKLKCSRTLFDRLGL